MSSTGGRKINPKLTPVNPPQALVANEDKSIPLPPGSFSVSRSEYSGPIPPPSMLREYNDLIPNGAERIFKAFEDQSQHRMHIEKSVINGDVKRSYWGLAAGYTITVLFLLACTFLIYKGHDTAGTVLGTVDIVTLAGVFVYGYKTREREKEKKSESISKKIKNE